MSAFKSKIARSIDDYISSRRTLMASNIILGLICLVLLFGLLKKDVVVIAIPPGLTEEAQISKNQANEAYYLTWANHIAGLAGNISPASADYIKTQLKVLLSPKLQQEIGDLLNEEIELLSARKATQRFIIENAIYDATNNISWIWGKRILEIPGLEARVTRWTYEVQIQPHNGMPRITYLNTYQGAPDRRNRPRGQNINPFLSHEQDSTLQSVDANAPVNKRELPQNVGAPVEIEINQEAGVESKTQQINDDQVNAKDEKAK